MVDNKPFYILGAAAALLLLFFIFLGSGGNNFDWSENYEAESKEPYGSFVIHEVLSDYFQNNNFTEIKEGLFEELPSSSSILNKRLYLATLSLLANDPVFI